MKKKFKISIDACVTSLINRIETTESQEDKQLYFNKAVNYVKSLDIKQDEFRKYTHKLVDVMCKYGLDVVR